jgi:hypothetical protein
MIDGLRKGTEASQEMNHVSIYSLAQQYQRERESARILASSGNTTFTKNYLLARPLSDSEKKRLEYIFLGIFVVAALFLLGTYLRGRPIEFVVADTLILFCLLLTNLYAWYLIPVFAALALRRSRLGTIYIFIGTALGLAYYPFYVYAHFNSGWEKFHVHLFLSLFLTVPLVLFLIAEAGEWGIGAFKRRRVATESPLPESPTVPRRTSVTSS